MDPKSHFTPYYFIFPFSKEDTPTGTVLMMNKKKFFFLTKSRQKMCEIRSKRLGVESCNLIGQVFRNNDFSNGFHSNKMLFQNTSSCTSFRLLHHSLTHR